MAQIVKIQVTACDNELYILASTPSGSSEICHLKSGFNNPVSYTVVPQSILPAGSYTLTVIGINWGGPSIFTVNLTDSTSANIPISGGSGLPAGGVFSQLLAITV
jgi:hypothetical protein